MSNKGQEDEEKKRERKNGKEDLQKEKKYKITGPFLLPPYISSRQGIVSPIPNTEAIDVISYLDDKLSKSTYCEKFSKYYHTITAEPKKRPIPHIFQATEFDNIYELAKEWYPFWFNVIKKRLLLAEAVTYENRSRLGYPYFEHTKIPGDKARLVEEHFKEYTSKDTLTEKPFTICNRRLQPEPYGKVREFLFINGEGVVYSESKPNYRLLFDDYYASRIRLVFNETFENLVKQVRDNQIHEVYLRSTVYHHDMTKPKKLRKYVLFLDIKHFERCVGKLVRLRAKYLGNGYNKLQEHCSNAPYLVPDDEFKKCFLVEPEDGYITQLGSGDSSVTGLGKEAPSIVFLSYIEKIVTTYKNKERLIEEFLDNPQQFPILLLDYGDDMVVTSDDKELLYKFFEYLQIYLTAEIEEESKFLGYQYREKEDRFVLTILSFINNFYRPERAPYTAFRPYPMYGRRQRRLLYAEYGGPEIQEYLALDDEVFFHFYDKAAYEQEYLKEEAQVKSLPMNLILEKEYLLTTEEKLTLPYYDRLSDEVHSKIDVFLGKVGENV